MNGNPISRDTIDLQEVRTEMLSCGTGETCFLFLHPERGMEGSEAFLRALGASGRVLAPYHPGYRLDAPDHFKSVDDLSYFYLDLLDTLDLSDVTLVGASLGGWIAMEVASKNNARINSLCLLAPAGVKISGRTSHDMQDIFSIDPQSVEALSFHDPRHVRPGTGAAGDAELELVARAREASARYAWLPYMHNPKLARRLHRIRIPSLIVWGTDDRIAPPGVGQALAGRLPFGEFQSVAACGHYPHIEHAETVAASVSAWRERHLGIDSVAVRGVA